MNFQSSLRAFVRKRSNPNERKAKSILCGLLRDKSPRNDDIVLSFALRPCGKRGFDETKVRLRPASLWDWRAIYKIKKSLLRGKFPIMIFISLQS